METQAAATVCHPTALGAVVYARRQPETTLLYKTPPAHWLGFLAEIETDGGEPQAFATASNT